MYYCPRCHARMHKGEFGWTCHNCLVSIPFVYRGYRIPQAEIERLLKKGQTSVISYWKRSDSQGDISGYLTFKEGYLLQFIPIVLEGVHCPKCGESILENSKGYLCTVCDFFLFKTLAGRVFTKTEVRQLLTYHEVGPLERFISKESGKFFTTKVYLKKDGTLSFTK